MTGGRVLRRRSFRGLALFVLAFFGGGAALPVAAALSSGEAGPMFGAAVILGLGSLAYRVTRSRVHIGETSLTVVNPLFSHEVPYGAIRRIEGNRAGSLIVLPKDGAADTEGSGYLVVGFAGSLLDRKFKTSDKAAAELKKRRHKGRHLPGADGPVRRKLAGDVVAETLLLAATVCAVASVTLR
ncbi:PH domain-containing protein [Streptomyces sp. NPDC046685]|uniref:PH domain-containing protein n=1 Tax=Streptomyces sp. NPDC046685 TaxID=3157202 RepID=UPI0034072884